MNLTLPNADQLVGIVFLIVIAVTIAGGLIACNADRLVRAVAGLIVCFVGVAGLYFFLNSPFIAMMQVLIYIGAVAVTISFAIMFAAPEQSKKHGPPGPLAGPLGIITAGLIVGGFVLLAAKTDWPIKEKLNLGSVEAIGISLLTDYSMVFELISIVLLIAIIGALVIARRGRSN
jgi:NADH-quinone oxidoreductase subunit J